MIGGLALAAILAAGVAYFALGFASLVCSGGASSQNANYEDAGSDALSADATISYTDSRDALGPPTLGDEDTFRPSVRAAEAAATRSAAPELPAAHA